MKTFVLSEREDGLMESPVGPLAVYVAVAVTEFELESLTVMVLAPATWAAV